MEAAAVEAAEMEAVETEAEAAAEAGVVEQKRVPLTATICLTSPSRMDPLHQPLAKDKHALQKQRHH